MKEKCTISNIHLTSWVFRQNRKRLLKQTKGGSVGKSQYRL